MNQLLADDLEHFPKILEQTVSIADTFIRNKEKLPPGRFIADIPMQHIPLTGLGTIGALDYFVRNFQDKLANSAGPNYFGFVTGGSTPASVAGDWLVSLYDQNACGSNDSIAPQIERQTIHFFKELFGLN